MNKDKYYSGTKVLSYGTPWIFSLGNRSIGKTTFWTRYVINRFKRKGRKFIYMRRYDEDLKKTATTFFDNIRFLFPNDSFKVEGNGKTGTKFYINEEFAGIAIALSGVTRFKSVGMADYDTIFYDEFLPEDGCYLSNEVGNCLSFYQSVARGFGQVIRTDVKFIFCANSVTLNNPLFRELKIRDRIQLGSKYTVDPDGAWTVEFTNNEEIANEIANTPFGKMMAKTKYGEYSLKNQFYLDDNNFIKKPTGESRYYCTLVWRGRNYGVYEYKEEGLLYVTTKADPNCKIMFALTTKDHQPNYLLMHKNKFNPIYNYLKYAYENALLRFDNQESKFMFLEIMQYSD